MVLASFDFAQYISEVIEELRPELLQKGATLVFRNDPPSVPVPMDQKRLLHVFTNLLHNAVDAMKGDGEIFFTFRLEGNEVITEIEDTGKGIAPEILPRLFEPFATFGKAKGTGLGLSICKKVIEDHRGWIRAQSEPGKGAVFSFSLPANVKGA
jgi:signal transduction histidine kinase